MMPVRVEYSRCKFNSRLKVAEMGYKILFNIRDQFADVTRKDTKLSIDKFYIGQTGDNGSSESKCI